MSISRAKGLITPEHTEFKGRIYIYIYIYILIDYLSQSLKTFGKGTLIITYTRKFFL